MSGVPDLLPDVDLGPVRRFVAEILLRILAFVGLALGGGQAAAAADIAALQQDSFLHDANVPAAPDQLALGRLRGVEPPFDYIHEAARSGVDPHRLDFLEDITGEPPAVEQLLEAFRRGIVDRDVLERGIRQSRVRNEWIPTVEALRFQPPGAGEVLAGWVQSHLSDGDAHAKLVDAGVNPDEHQWLYDTTGRPPDPTTMLNLLNRRFLTEDDVRLAVRESDIKNKYIDAILASRVYIPPVRTIGVLVANGALSDDRARDLYRENGVRDDDIAAYLASAHHAKTASHKMLAVAELQTLYQERYVSKEDVVASLVGLGYSEADAELVLAVADLRRWRKFLDQAIGRVHTLYVGHKIDANTAGTTLDQVGVQPEQKADLLALWDLEREANVRLLTPSQIVAAVAYQILSPEQAAGRLVDLGYAADDAAVLIELKVGPPLPEQPV